MHAQDPQLAGHPGKRPGTRSQHAVDDSPEFSFHLFNSSLRSPYAGNPTRRGLGAAAAAGRHAGALNIEMTVRFGLAVKRAQPSHLRLDKLFFEPQEFCVLYRMAPESTLGWTSLKRLEHDDYSSCC